MTAILWWRTLGDWGLDDDSIGFAPNGFQYTINRIRQSVSSLAVERIWGRVDQNIIGTVKWSACLRLRLAVKPLPVSDKHTQILSFWNAERIGTRFSDSCASLSMQWLLANTLTMRAISVLVQVTVVASKAWAHALINEGPRRARNSSVMC